MLAGITHVALAQPLPEAVLVAITDEFGPQTAAMPGFEGLFIVQPDELQLAIVVLWATAADRDRAAKAVGSPFYELLGTYIAHASQAEGEVLIALSPNA